MDDLLKSLFQTLQNFIVPFLVRNILKIGGSFIVYAGWTENDVTYIIAGLVAMILGAVGSWLRDKILKSNN